MGQKESQKTRKEVEEMAKGEGGGQRPPGEDLAVQFFMHPGQHGASVRPCEPERGETPRAWHRGCGQAKAKKALAPGQVGTLGSPGTRGTQLSPHLPRLRGGGWS